MKFFLVLFMCTLCVTQISYAQCTKADIVILVDYSGSISGNESAVKKALVASAGIFDGASDMRVSIVTFSDNFEVVVPFTANLVLYSHQVNRLEVVSDNSTRMADAIDFAQLYFAQLSRPGTRKVVILVSDGKPNSPSLANTTVTNAKKDDILFFSIYISSDYGYSEAKRFMLSVASEAHYFFQSSYSDLGQLLQDLDPCM